MDSMLTNRLNVSVSVTSALNQAFFNDCFPEKINLFHEKDENCCDTSLEKATIFKVLSNPSVNKEYLSAHGELLFNLNAMKLLLGKDKSLIDSGKVNGIQTPSGTGALFLALKFINFVMKIETILIPAPVSEKYLALSKFSGFEKIKQYRFWEGSNSSLDCQDMVDNLMNSENSSVIVLPACYDKTTGTQLPHDIWLKLVQILKDKRIFIIFDLYNPGLASGNIDTDFWPVRQFINEGYEMLICQRFSKISGYCSYKIGHLTVVIRDSVIMRTVLSQINQLVSWCYLSPPFYAGRVMGILLDDTDIHLQWKKNVHRMVTEWQEKRDQIFQTFISLESEGSWTYITKQVGRFWITNLTERQVDYLKHKKHIYTTSDGRINLSAVKMSNVEKIVKSIEDAIKNS